MQARTPAPCNAPVETRRGELAALRVQLLRIGLARLRLDPLRGLSLRFRAVGEHSRQTLHCLHLPLAHHRLVDAVLRRHAMRQEQLLPRNSPITASA
jgi:hypothetical protein